MRVFHRHRGLSIGLLVFTLLIVAAAFVKLPWTYQAESDVVLIPSQVAGVKNGFGNPYLAYDGSLNEVGDVIGYEVTDMEEKQNLKSQGDSSGYTITDAANTSAPILVVQVAGNNATNVLNTLRAVTDQINTKLAAMQSQLGSSNRIQDQTISYTNNATRMTSKKFRPLLMVVVVALMLSGLIVLAVDAMQAGRRRDKRAEPSRSSAPESAAQQEHPSPVMQESHGSTRDGSLWGGNDFERMPNGTGATRAGEYTARPDVDWGQQRAPYDY
jgi:hypothetical protein